MGNAADALLRVTDRLFAAVTVPEGWPQVLEMMADLLGADHAILQAAESETDIVPVLAYARLDERDMALSYAAHEACDGAPFSTTALPIGKAFTRAELMPDRDFAGSAYYNEVVRPLNGFHSISLRQAGSASNFILSFCRPQTQENFNGWEATTMSALLPHLTTAIDLHYRLHAAEHRHESLTCLIDRLDTGVVLVDAAGRPLLANACAASIAADADGLTLEDAGIAAASISATRSLREAIAKMASDDAAAPKRLNLSRPSLRAPLQLTLFPVWRLGMVVPGAKAPRVAIFVKVPDAAPALEPQTLREALHLTQREAEVAVLLASGYDLATVATSLGLGLGTVRHHLKRVYEKTGANSQVKLVTLLRGFADSLHQGN